MAVPEAVAAWTDVVADVDTVCESVGDSVDEMVSDGDDTAEGVTLASVAVTDALLSVDGETLTEMLPLGVIDTLATVVMLD